MSQNDPLLGNDWLEKDDSISGRSIQTNGINGNKCKTQLSQTSAPKTTIDSQFNQNNSVLNQNSNQLIDNYLTNRTPKPLLSAIAMSSSDSSTDDIVIPMQRRKVKTRFSRKRRSRSTDSNLSIKSRALISCPSICLKIVLILMIISSIAFTILFIAKLYDRIDSLQTSINELRISGGQVPGEMHSMHSRLQALDSNMSSVKTNLSIVFDRIENITQEVIQIKLQMTKISDSVEAAPAIRQLPKELQDLQKVVVEMGSRLTTNDNEVKTVKENQNSQQSRTDSLQLELNAIHVNISELYANIERNNSSISVAKLEQNTNQLNQLSENLKHLQTFYTDLINWKTDAEARLQTVMLIAHHIHEKLHNESISESSTPLTDPKHESHNTNESNLDLSANKSTDESTTGASVPLNQTTL